MIGRAQALAVTQSGSLGAASWRLGPGRYELYCSMPGHLQARHAREAGRALIERELA